MDWSATVDAYCERLDATFWSEPLNAATNIAFLLAAVAAAAYARRRGGLDLGVGALVAILAAIGVGSFLFHTVATRWAGLADVVPIQLFILAYFVLALRRLAGFSVWGALAATAAFVGFTVVAVDAVRAVAGTALNGSESYVPPLVALLAVGAGLIAAGRRGGGWALVGGAALFAVSLVFRTVDAAVCAAFPTGTHFAWHVLNAVLLGWLIVALVRFRVTPAR